MKKRNLLAICALLTMIINSCSVDDTSSRDEYLMTTQEAISISKDLEYSELSLRSNTYEVNAEFIVKDKDDANAILILNQSIGEEKYFSVISLDKRTLPVLAFGSGEFSLAKSGPETNFWLNGQIELIEKVRRDNPTLEGFVAIVNNQNDNLSGPSAGPCSSFLVWNGPIIDHTWGQECVYNEECPSMSCSVGVCASPKAFTGCVATAIVQILGYHEQPSSYQWNTMLNRYNELNFSSPGANEIADAMADAGAAVNMSYDCDESSVPLSGLESILSNTFKNIFGYTSGGNYGESIDISAWNGYASMHNSIGTEQPVLLIGLNHTQGSGHAWVCDGTRMQGGCNEPTTFFYHMNWGWNGNSNGWYVGYGLFPDETVRVAYIKP